MAINFIEPLKKIGTAISSLQSKKMSKTQFSRIRSSSYKILTYSNMKNASSWTVQDISNVFLIGNLMCINVYAKRSSATGSGDISNQNICTFTVNDERITYMPTVFGAIGYAYGPPSIVRFQSSKTGDHTWNCTIDLTYTHSALSSVGCRFLIPITIDVTKF